MDELCKTPPALASIQMKKMVRIMEKLPLRILLVLNFSTAITMECARKANSAKGDPTASAQYGNVGRPTKLAGVAAPLQERKGSTDIFKAPHCVTQTVFE
jgi:hypothetical protein